MSISVGENEEKLESSSFIASEMSNGIIILEGRVIVSYKVKHTFTIRPRNSVLIQICTYSREMKRQVHTKTSTQIYS